MTPSLNFPILPPDRPWERLTDEPEDWFARFTVFLTLGTGRTMSEIFRREGTGKESTNRDTRCPTYWYEMRNAWRWLERAAAWDLAMANERREKYKKKLEKFYDDTIESLLKEAQREMDYPIARKEIKGEKGEITIVIPNDRWNKASAVKMYEVAEKFMRSCAGETENKTEVNITNTNLVGQGVVMLPPAGITGEELKKLLPGGLTADEVREWIRLKKQEQEEKNSGPERG